VKSPTHTKILNVNVVVGALGYFVDIYDLLLFGIVRMVSLRDIGVSEEKLLETGVFLINCQMSGLLVGGILWGVLGDKKGRLSVLFGSILLYSLANLANAFVTNVETYAALRFIAGIGLAGELGAAITLVAETMPIEKRGYGSAIIAAVGILGAIFAAVIGDLFNWKIAYIIGGVMGLGLLALRVSMAESGMFEHVQQAGVRRGDLRMLFYPAERMLRYVRCILIGVPLWFMVGILLTFSPELGRALGVTSEVNPGHAIAFGYAGLSLGDLACGLMSQYFKSRRKAVAMFLGITAVGVVWFLNLHGASIELFYGVCVFLGIGCGFWAMFVSIASEQFGTNMRATVATTVPNFVRGSVVVLTSSFQYLKEPLGLLGSAGVVGAASLAIAALALYKMEETFHKDLNFLER
jgi:putative MFS transporter